MKNTIITIILMIIIVTAIGIYFLNLNKIFNKNDFIKNINMVEQYALQSDWYK
ncbi:hypothetical protein [Tepidibacter mesophilus]|uniref:hypothetical protein n=1 Tax=Tepidibacter mesophilus TaxID=655607 RepID=UPI0016511DC6|nr:hypothetical protein [Tepidibacter mesophilus]